MTSTQINSFLKWVGGKKSIISELSKRLPKSYTEYHELFVGSGSFFFAIKPKKAHLYDVNFNLIITFRIVRDDVDKLINILKKHKINHNKEYYLKARKQLLIKNNPLEIAGLLIYLNKTCFNGLYRVNKNGEFNVPIGSYKNPSIVNEKKLKSASRILQNVKILHCSFEKITVKQNAFYYLDPPYHEAYNNYNSNIFGEKEHKQLTNFCHKINEVNGFFMLSNSNTSLIKTLYKKYNIEQIMSFRSISCKVSKRGQFSELIIRNYN